MNIYGKTAIAVAIVTPIAFTFGAGLGAISFVIDESIKEYKTTHPKLIPNSNGPSVERIKSKRKLKKTYTEFDKIVDKY